MERKNLHSLDEIVPELQIVRLLEPTPIPLHHQASMEGPKGPKRESLVDHVFRMKDAV